MTTIATICGNPRDPVSVYTTAVVDRALEGKVTSGRTADRLWRESVRAADEASRLDRLLLQSMIDKHGRG